MPLLESPIRRWLLLAATLVLAAAAAVASAAGRRVETLTAAGGIPAHIVGAFREPTNFQQAKSGQYFVFDRRGHTVYGIDEATTAAWKIVEIGQEVGRIIEPSAFDIGPGGTFVVADAPNNRERIQIFTAGGHLLGGFTLPGRASARVTLGPLVLNGIGSLQYTGRSILMSQPETGALVTEYSLSGAAIRTFGALRRTSLEADRDVHLALNSGLPLVNPRGGYYFVFQTGEPLFRRYDEGGKLLFERHVEGKELDALVATQPTSWPRRKTGAGELPLVTPNVRTAAVDSAGNLWIAFTIPYTYVYDSDGEKSRVVQFRAGGILSPASLFFTADGRLLVTPGCYEFTTK